MQSPGFITSGQQINFIAAFGVLVAIPVIPSAVRRVLGGLIPVENSESDSAGLVRRLGISNLLGSS